jgi:hypothetical protein
MAFVGSNLALGVHQILKIYGGEQDGALTITTTDIPVNIQAFLFRKGFRRPGDIQRLVDIGGYLSCCLLLLLVILRRQPHNFGGSRKSTDCWFQEEGIQEGHIFKRRDEKSRFAAAGSSGTPAHERSLSLQGKHLAMLRSNALHL